MKNKYEALAYSDLFDFFNQEHGLILLNSEMDDIIKAVEKFKIQFNGNKKTDDTSTTSETTY